jgi:hypothetical protein
VQEEWEVWRRYFSQESMRQVNMPEARVKLTAPPHLEPVR